MKPNQRNSKSSKIAKDHSVNESNGESNNQTESDESFLAADLAALAEELKHIEEEQRTQLADEEDLAKTELEAQLAKEELEIHRALENHLANQELEAHLANIAKTTAFVHKQNDNSLDFKFGAYCDFRDYINNLDDDITKLARSLEILYETDLSDYPIDSLLTLYNSTIESINNYEPTNELTWNGYSISWVKDYKRVTVGEAITLLEFDQRAQKDQSDGFSGNIDYNLGLEQLAVLLRKPDEKIPIDPTERFEWIDRRKHEVADAPLWLVLNTRFFFLKKYREYLKMNGIDTYLTVLKQIQLMSLNSKLNEIESLELSLSDGDGL